MCSRRLFVGWVIPESRGAGTSSVLQAPKPFIHDFVVSALLSDSAEKRYVLILSFLEIYPQEYALSSVKEMRGNLISCPTKFFAQRFTL